MSDNTIIPAAAGGDNVRTIDKARDDLAKIQVMSIDIGGAEGERLWRGEGARDTNELLQRILDALVEIKTHLRGF
jgi:hypothetical protein